MERFEEAASKLQDFLEKQGHSRQIVWIARDDVIFVGKPFFYIKSPEPSISEQLARQEYEIGAGKGLGVLLEGFREVDGTMLSFVWSPSDEDEAQRMLMPGDGGLKMSIRIWNPEFSVRMVRSRLLWLILKALYGRNEVNRENWQG